MTILRFSQKVYSKRKIYNNVIKSKIYLNKVFYIIAFYNKNTINIIC